MTPTKKVTPFLMFKDLGPAMEFYAATVPGFSAENVVRAGKDGPVMSAELVFDGQRFLAYSGGAHFKFSDAFSLFVLCEDQREVDAFWDKLVTAGSTPVRCGWITDPFGLSWQIIPRRFTELMSDKDPKKVQAVMAAMMQMTKLEVAGLEKAYAGA
jgi:predicted 3-demethylubiquinone-9 3-methyltransferase (glyoxalase superfamily)